VRTDKSKEFLNKHFQDMLQDEGIQFQVCRNADLKCAVVESVHRTFRDRIYKYFTYKNPYRYIDVLPKFVKAYNDTLHSTTGMAPSRVTDSDVLAIWKRMEAAPGGVRVAKAATFRVGQHVRISKEKMRFAKVAEQIFSTEIFKVAKVTDRRPRAVYELDDLNGTPIEGQFYREELTPVRITDRASYKIDKTLDKMFRPAFANISSGGEVTFPPPRILLRSQNKASLRKCRYAMTSPPVIPKDPATVSIQG